MQKLELNLSEVAGGELQRKVNQAFTEVMHNMHDVNTPYKKKREIDLKISFEQDESRSECTCSISVSTKLAHPSPMVSRFYSAKNLDTGDIAICSGNTDGIRGQMDFDDVGITTGDVPDNVDPETGEILEPDRRIVDFQEQRKKA